MRTSQDIKKWFKFQQYSIWYVELKNKKDDVTQYIKRGLNQPSLVRNMAKFLIDSILSFFYRSKRFYTPILSFSWKSRSHSQFGPKHILGLLFFNQIAMLPLLYYFKRCFFSTNHWILVHKRLQKLNKSERDFSPRSNYQIPYIWWLSIISIISIWGN